MSDHFGNITISDGPRRKPKATRPRKPTKPVKKKVATAPKPKKIRKEKKERKEIRWGRFFLLTTLISAFILALYTGFGFLVVPKLLQTSLTEELQSSTGLEISIGKTNVNPFSFRVQLQDILVKGLPTSDDKRPLLQLEQFDINLEITSILRSRLVCSSLNINNFSLTITRDKEKKYNFATFASTTDTAKSSDIIEFSKLPFLFSFNNIVVDQGEVIFDDHFSSKHHKIEKIKLTLPTLANFTRLVTGSVEPRFSAVINGSPIELKGDNIRSIGGEPDDSRTKLSCNISELDLPLYFDYLPSSIPLSLTKGIANGTLQLSFSMSENSGRRLSVDFDVVTTQIDLHTEDKTLSLKTPKTKFRGSIQPFTGSLYLQEFVVKEPVISVGEGMSQQSLVVLMPFLKPDEQKKGSPRKKRDLLIEKLVLDNGTLHIKTKTKTETWGSLLFNLNQFSNNYNNGKNGVSAGSFSLSGEQPKNGATISWKGALNQNDQITGDMTLSSLSASSLFSLLGADVAGAAKGTCDVQGQFSLSKGSKQSEPLNYSMKNGTISINNLHLFYNNNEWLHAPKLTFSAFNSDNDHYDFGNIFVENGTLTIKNNDLPPLVGGFSKNKNYLLHGIDFQGKLSVSDKDNQQQAIELTQLHFQSNNLDKKKNREDNFGLTATVGKRGELKSKGTLSLQPFAGSFTISFSNMPLSQIASYYTDNPLFLKAEGSLGGQGKLTFPGWSYKGSLGIDKANFSEQKNNRHMSWSKATIGDFLITKSPSKLKTADISVSNLVIEENKQRWFRAKSFKTDEIKKEKKQLYLGNINIKKGTLTLAENNYPQLLENWFKQQESSTHLTSVTYSGSVAIQPKNKSFEPLQLSNVSFSADELDKKGRASNNFTLKSGVNGAGVFQAKGDLSLTPLTAVISTNFSSIKSKVIFPWITDARLFLESQAVFSGKGKLAYPRNTFSGYLKVSNARIRKNPDKLLLGWDEAELFKTNIELEPLAIRTPKVIVKQPGFGWSRIHTDGNSYQQARSFLEDITANDSTANNTNKQAKLEIGTITIKNGLSQYFDKRLTPGWQANISSINGTIKEIHTGNPDTVTKFNVSGSMAGSPVTIMGSARLFSEKTNGDSLVKITTVPLHLFDKQITPVLQLDTSLGTFDLVMKSKWTDGHKSGSAHYGFTSLTASSSDAETAVPVALLSDYKNQTQLYVPLEGDERQAVPSIFTETVSVFQTKLIKAKYSPVLLAGHEFSDLVDINTVQCIAGKKGITDHGKSVMRRYSDLAKKHPKLRLEIIGVADSAIDGIHLKKELAAKETLRVQEENRRRAEQRKKRKEEALKRKQAMAAKPKKGGITESNIPLENNENLAPISAQPVTVSEDILKELAADRAQEVYDQFIAINGLTSEQLTLGKEQLNQDQNHKGNQVIIKLAARR